ncbi:hypothetical protein CVT26_013058, partial [Gymnopilus dilepis]
VVETHSLENYKVDKQSTDTKAPLLEAFPDLKYRVYSRTGTRRKVDQRLLSSVVCLTDGYYRPLNPWRCHLSRRNHRAIFQSTSKRKLHLRDATKSKKTDVPTEGNKTYFQYKPRPINANSGSDIPRNPT